MTKFKILEPIKMFFRKSDGNIIEVDMKRPISEQLDGEYPTVTVRYEEGAKTMKNVTVVKRNTPMFFGPNNEVEQELVYDIYWEEEE